MYTKEVCDQLKSIKAKAVGSKSGRKLTVRKDECIELKTIINDIIGFNTYNYILSYLINIILLLITS